MRISCSNEKNLDKCAFATAGSIVYYAEFSENYQVSESLGQQPAPVPRKPTFTARLRKQDDFYGEKVRISGRFVILENKRIHKSHPRFVSVWDLNLIKRVSLQKLSQQPAPATSKDTYIAYVTSLTKSDANFHDGVDCKLLEIRTSKHGNVEAGEMIIQSEYSESTEDQKLRINYKKLLPWSVEVTGDLSAEELKSYKVIFSAMDGGAAVPVTFEQMFDLPKEFEKVKSDNGGDDLLML